MMNGVNQGNIDCIIVKDMSRKIKSTFKAKGESGKHTGSNPPYGYIKDKDDKNQWIIDEKAAEVVRRIFHLKMEMEKKKTRLTDSTNRLQELEHLMCRIYEDMILEKIPNNRYEILNNQYETEQRELSKEIDGLEKAIKRYEKETDRAKKFIRLIERYDNFDELTPTIINEFVEKILIHERDRKGSQTANQKVEIYFNFIGNYEPPKEELSEEEMQKLREEEEKERARKDRLHQNYLKRKANGKQKEYEERYKARREEKKQEKLKVLKRTGIPVSEYKNMETKLT